MKPPSYRIPQGAFDLAFPYSPSLYSPRAEAPNLVCCFALPVTRGLETRSPPCARHSQSVLNFTPALSSEFIPTWHNYKVLHPISTFEIKSAQFCMCLLPFHVCWFWKLHSLRFHHIFIRTSHCEKISFHQSAVVYQHCQNNDQPWSSQPTRLPNAAMMIRT